MIQALLVLLLPCLEGAAGPDDHGDMLQHHGVTNNKIKQRKVERHPLLTVLDTRPHSITLMIKPMDYKQDTMIRLMYERVPTNKGPFILSLDDPVVEVIPMRSHGQTHTLSELPMGKYIVCAEAMLMGEVFQSSCLETHIQRLENNSED